MTRLANDDDRYALYANAHHDLWWARTQQWRVANWALLLIAGIVSIGRELAPSWPYVVLVFVVALLAGRLFGNLHGEIVHNREVYRELEEQTGVKQLRKTLPGQERGEENTDAERGIGVLISMVAVIAGASGFAVLYLRGTLPYAVALGIGILVFDVAWIQAVAWVWKDRQQLCRTCSHKRLMHHENGACFKASKPDCTCTGFVALDSLTRE